MLKTTNVSNSLRSYQLALNNYVWGTDGIDVNVTETSTDTVFSKLKPMFKKLASPMYLTFSLNIDPSDSGNSYGKIKKVFDFINTIGNYAVSGAYNVAPIVQYALFKNEGTSSEVNVDSDPALYFAKAVKLSGNNVEFRFRDILLEQLQSLISEQSGPDSFALDPTSRSFFDDPDVKDVFLNRITLSRLFFYDIKKLDDSNLRYSDKNDKRGAREAVSQKEFEDKISVSQLYIIHETLKNYYKNAADIRWMLPHTDTLGDEYRHLYKLAKKLEALLLTDAAGNLDSIITTLETTLSELNDDNRRASQKKTDFFNTDFSVIESINSLLDEIEVAVPTDERFIDDRELSNIDIFKSFNYKSVKFFIRLYPKAAQLAYPNSKLMTGTVSDNRILSIHNGFNNLECNLVSNLALNTLDAQWLDLYANVFDFMSTINLSSGFTLKFGNYSIPNCQFKRSPRLVNNGQTANMFNLELISSVKSLKDITVNTYYSSEVSGE